MAPGSGFVSGLRDRVPALRRGFRLQWEPAQGCHVLLYPEGMVQLNDSASHILQAINGRCSVADIVEGLRARFPDAPQLEDEVLAFLEIAHARHWIELR